MPLYEYQCRDCGRRLEIIQKFSEDPLTECSECGGTLEKVLSAPAFHLKGSGWYKTDYARKDGGKKKDSPDSKAEKSEKNRFFQRKESRKIAQERLRQEQLASGALESDPGAHLT